METDYIYGETEDYFSNVDYTMPDNFDFLEQQRTTYHVKTTSVDISELFAHTILITSVWLALTFLSLNKRFPGHKDPGYWPIFVPDFYGERCSQHLFDPYSFVHFGHGILSFYAFGALDEEHFFEHERYSLTEIRVTKNLEKVSTKRIGLVTTLFFATLTEQLENSPYIINLFRNNTGKLH